MHTKLISLAGSFAMLASVGSAQAAFFSGTPTPSLNPTFGTLVNFDDKPTHTAVGAADYASVGVTSITETEGLGFFAYYGLSSQSDPNYLGTGFDGERGTDTSLSWDGTILIEFATLVSKVGLGVLDSSEAGGETMKIYDASMMLLETGVVPIGAVTYSYFESVVGIKYLEIRGDFFGIDDLQFSPVPEPSTYVLFGLGLLTLVGVRRRLRKSA